MPQWNVFSRTCPSRTSLAQIANKWTAMIIISLGDGPLRFSQLQSVIEGISNKVLTSTLRSLERDGMLVRSTAEQTVFYELTPLGRTLDAPLKALQDWAEGHIEEVLDARDSYDSALDAPLLQTSADRDSGGA